MTVFTTEGPLSPRLYAEGFGGSEGEAEAALSALSRAGAVPLRLSCGEAPLSQGAAIPLSVDGCRILYLYALSTAVAARGQGHLRTLIKETARWAAAEGVTALCLLPADEGLSAAYRRMGFTLALPAGANALSAGGEEFSLYAEAPLTPMPTEDRAFLYSALGGAMSRAAFDFTLDTLADSCFTARWEKEAAILSRKDPRRALAVTEGLSPTYRVCPAAHLLVMPLVGNVPPIPEPLPR